MSSTRPILRRANIHDAPALVRLINAAYRTEDFFVTGNRTNLEDVSGRIAAQGGGFLVIEGTEYENLAGAVYVELRGERGYFGLLSVDPGRQKQGLGRLLVEGAEAYCREAGCRALDIEVVNVRTELPPFYAKFGFVPFATAPFPHPQRLRQDAHLVLMSKSLTI